MTLNLASMELDLQTRQAVTYKYSSCDSDYYRIGVAMDNLESKFIQDLSRLKVSLSFQEIVLEGTGKSVRRLKQSLINADHVKSDSMRIAGGKNWLIINSKYSEKFEPFRLIEENQSSPPFFQLLVVEMFSNLKKFIPKLSRLIMGCNWKIVIAHFFIPEKQLKRVFSVVKNILNVELANCRFVLTSSANFSKCFTRCAIQELRFRECGSESNNLWEPYSEQFEYLARGISTPDLIQSLKRIQIEASNLSKQYFMDIMQTYGFNHVELIWDSSIVKGLDNICDPIKAQEWFESDESDDNLF
ncbi:unnamed protein product [Moneuplotes crassus]|uniref:Uncharacterized protein n=1 Tax=Euplotes crassus TaxID=5936 RepID=A0AAD1XP49_EUPCR|nr:unnamed protein product [Moneuplotes crassus]